MVEQLTYRLDQFEGPLDLLLTLIQKNKVSITDIPIAMICDQYMEYLAEAERMDLDIASDFIVMASQLMLIKSQMLLPHEEGMENDPRREIRNALLLHMRAKQAAKELRPMYEEYSGRFVKGTDDVPPEKGLPLDLDPDLLVKALNAVLRRIKVAEADSVAIQGENEAKMKIAMSEATLKEKEAEAQKIATAAEKIQAAKALGESYAAEMAAEIARRNKEQATLEADIIVRAEARKKELELEAEAKAEQLRRTAKGEADAIYAKMEAEARGAEEILKKQAAGFAEIVSSAGGDANAALQLLIADKLEELMKVQVEAIKNIKIDKVTVWDGGQGADGKTSTANFISGMMKSVPPLDEMFKMAGMQLPSYLGTKAEEAEKSE